MNIFLPCKTITESVQVLDDRRLVKQILECFQILQVSLGNSDGYSHHPVVIHYKKSSGFVASYGYTCCVEYMIRFGKSHQYMRYFRTSMLYLQDFKYTPFYAEYPKTDSRCIRTTVNVEHLFRQKLIKKWREDKYPPKWTNRPIPSFYCDLPGSFPD